MAKQINIGVGGVVKKVSKVPASIGGVVKQMKKGVCGIGGVVKTFFTGNVIYEDGGEGYDLETYLSVTTGLGCLVSKESDYLSFSVVGYSNSSGTMSYSYAGVYTKEKIDLTNISKIQVTIYCVSILYIHPAKHYFRIRLDSETGSGTSAEYYSSKYLYDSETSTYYAEPGETYVHTYDVSSRTGEYYIKAGFYAGECSTTEREFARILKIELIESE